MHDFRSNPLRPVPLYCITTLVRLNDTTKGAPMYRRFLTNFGYFTGRTYATIDEAVAASRASTFDTTIYHGDKPVGAYSFFGGFRRF